MASITNIELILETIQNQQKVYNTVVSKALSAGDVDATKITKAEKSIKKMDGFISVYLNSVDNILKIITAQYAGSRTLSEALEYVEDVTDDKGEIIKKGGYKNIEAIQAVFQLYSGLSKSIETIAKLEIDKKTSKSISSKGKMIANVLENSVKSMIEAFQSIDKDKLQSLMDILTSEPSTITHIANSSKVYQPENKNLIKDANNVKDITRTGRMGLLDVFDKVLTIISTFLGMKLPNPMKFVIKVKLWGVGVKFVFNELFGIINKLDDPNRIKIVARFATTTEKLNESLTNIMMIDSTISMISKKLLGHIILFEITKKIAIPSFIKTIKELLNLPSDIAGEGGDIDSDIQGAAAFIEKITPIISSTQEFIDSIKELSKSLIYFNIARVVILHISIWGIKSILHSLIHKNKNGEYKGLLVEIVNFTEFTKNLNLDQADQATDSIKTIINDIKSIVGDILILALAAPALFLAFPLAIGAVLFITLFVKASSKLISTITSEKQNQEMVMSVASLAKVIAMLLGTILLTIATLVLIALCLPILVPVVADTLKVLGLISLVLLAITGLAWLVNKIFMGGVAKQIEKGILVMIVLIGVMLIAAGMIMLLGLVGIVFFKDSFWLLALGMFFVVGAVTLAIAGLGYLIAAMVPGIALFTTGIVLVLISITAMLLIGVELLLLAKFKFDDTQRQAIRETTATIIGAVHDVLDAVFNGVDDEGNIKRSNDSAFSKFFKSIFKGATFVVEALAASLTLVLTFVSVTMLLLIGLELKLLVHYNLDRDAVKENVNIIMDAANTCIDAIFQPNDKQPESSGSRFGKALKHLFVGAAEVLSLIVGVGKLALVMVAILLIKLVSLELKLIANNNLDANKVKTNVNTIMGAANACIDAIFQPNDKEPEGSGSRFFGAIGHFFVGLADIIQLIVSIGKLALMMVTFGLLKLLTNQLISISNLDTDAFANIPEKVRSIMSAAQTCIDAIFQPNDKQQEGSGTWLGGIIKKVFKGYGDTLTTILAIGRLSLMLAAIGMIKVVVEHLNEIVNISFTESAVKQKVDIIIGSANACIDGVFGEEGNIVKEYLKYKKDIKELENVSDFIRTLNKQLTVLSKELVKINNTTTSILGITPATTDEDALTTIVNTILAPINTLQSTTIELSFTSKIGKLTGFESLKNALMQINDITNSILGITPATNDENALTTIVNTILAPINTLQSTTIELSFTSKIGKLTGFESLKNALMQINDITNSILGITPATNDENALNVIINEILNPVKNLQFIDIKHIKISFSNKINDIVKLFEFEENLSKQLTRQQRILQTISFSFGEIVDSLVFISESINKVGNIKVADITDVTEQIIENINTVSKNRIDNKRYNTNIDAFNALSKSIEDFYKIGNSNNTRFKEGVDKAIEFTKVINDTKLDNLQTATNMFSKMSEFSKSINGNFEGLADTINEKIMPLLEKLNDALKETNDGIKSGAFNRPVVEAAVTEGVVAGGGTPVVGGTPAGTSVNPRGQQGQPVQPQPKPINYSSKFDDIKNAVEELTKLFKSDNTSNCAKVKTL